MSTRVNRGLAWIGIASSLVGVFDLVAITLILRFWVTPAEYGIATMAAWIFPILDQATDLGLSAALVQRDDVDEHKQSTVFWITLMCAAALFGLLLIVAPLLAHSYGHEVIALLLLAYGTKLFWQNIYAVPMAMMKRELRFKELSVVRIIANVAELGGKIGFAAAGFGVWCFVLGPLCRVFVTGIGAQICHPWRPKLVFRFREARDYVRFGLKTSGSQMLFYFYTNIDYPIVGHYFGATALGFYKLAYEIALEPARMISYIVVDIAFPAFARLRYARDKLIAQLVSFTRLNLITVLTYAAVVFVSANDVLAVFYPEYARSATAMRILCSVAVLRSVAFVLPPLLDGVGQPQRTFKYMLAASVVLPLMFLLGAYSLGDLFGASTVVIKGTQGVVSDGYLSVAFAWVLGYPIAFAFLVAMTMQTISWTARAYIRSVIGVIGCILAAGCIGAGAHALMGGIPALARFVLTTIAIR
ncbi:MAG: oligosaccharide flippase family protein, partial [Kofleriaceae bacterium]